MRKGTRGLATSRPARGACIGSSMPGSRMAVPMLLSAIVAGSFTCPVFSQMPAQSNQPSSRLSGKVSFNKVSGPECGVELLEKIFSRVMSLPQIAMTKSSKPAEEQAQRADAPGVDYTLAIRPKETGKIFAPQPPSLRVLPPSKLNSYQQKNAVDLSFGDDGVSRESKEEGTFQAGASAGSNFGAGASSIPPETDEFNIETWKGGNLQRVAGQQRARDARDLPATRAADNERIGIWDKADKDKDLPALTTGHPASGTEFGASSFSNSTRLSGLPPTITGKPISSPGDNMYGGYRNTVSSKQKSSDFKALAAAAQPPQTRRGAENKSQIMIAARQKAEFYSAPRRIQIIDERPVVSDFREAPSPTTIQLPPPPPGYNNCGNAGGYAQRVSSAGAAAPSPVQIAQNKSAPGYVPSAAPFNNAKKSAGVTAPGSNVLIPAQIISIDDASTLRKQSQQGALSSSRANALSGQLYNQLQDRGASGEKRELIALLPPNVATGIPLVSLGTSQMQVATALQNMGQLKEQRINRWTVMTYKKPESAGGKTSLQLFFRNGLLDAIRIFDPTLVAPDFGVAPGDSLERVKEKFGEPAFLIQEPSQGPGQNYIYPISQVGFQLARDDSKTAPKVVSVLIFSVK